MSGNGYWSPAGRTGGTPRLTAAAAGQLTQGNTRMTVLVLPEKRKNRDGKRVRLSFFPPVLGGRYESLCSPTGELIRWKDFHVLRLRCGAWIETDEPERVHAALGLPANAAGIILKLFTR